MTDIKKIATCLVVDSDGFILVLYLNDHPHFGNDIDLPGGTLDPGETSLQTAVREVREEAGIVIPEGAASLLHEGVEYSRHNTYYALYLYNVSTRPDVTLSWEHGSYEWVDVATFLRESRAVTDTYMHMAADMVEVNKIGVSV